MRIRGLNGCALTWLRPLVGSIKHSRFKLARRKENRVDSRLVALQGIPVRVITPRCSVNQMKRDWRKSGSVSGMGEPSQDHTICQLWRRYGETVSDRGTERMADVDDFLKVRLNLVDLPFANQRRELGQGGYLDGCLIFFDGIEAARSAQAQPIVAEGRVAMIEEEVHIAVVVVVVAEVPVAAIKTNAVGQDLKRLPRSTVRLAVGSPEVERAGDVGEHGSRRSRGLISSDIVENEVRDLNVGLGRWEVEGEILRRDRDGDIKVSAVSGTSLRRGSEESNSSGKAKVLHC